MMKRLTRFLLWVFVAAIVAIGAGCTPSPYEKGIRHYRPDDVTTAVRELQPLAERGDAAAQFNLGSLYFQGLGVSQDYPEAVRWMRKAAEQGNLFAQATLGTIYAEGVKGVVEQDPPQALMWLIFASAQGDPDALEMRNTLAGKMTPVQIAEAQKRAREFKPQATQTRSFLELKVLAEQGDQEAQFKLGVMAYTGQGVPVDFVEALDWFRKAALQGHPLAQYNTGYMYEKGEGTPQNYLEAAHYYQLSAERGNRRAQYVLGILYEKGQGVPMDDVQALKWYNLAAVQGEIKAKAARERMTVWMTAAQIVEAQRLAREFRLIGK